MSPICIWDDHAIESNSSAPIWLILLAIISIVLLTLYFSFVFGNPFHGQEMPSHCQRKKIAYFSKPWYKKLFLCGTKGYIPFRYYVYRYVYLSTTFYCIIYLTITMFSEIPHIFRDISIYSWTIRGMIDVIYFVGHCVKY